MKAKNSIGWSLVVASTAYFAACGGETYIASNNENVEDSGTTGGEAGQGSGGDSGSGGSSSGGESGSSGTAGGAAGSGGTCTPGETKTLGTCEKCGTSTQTCDSAGTWGPPTCVGAGPCSPGETSASGCSDPCSAKTCGSDCQWSGCGLKAGAACMYEGGTNFQCCGTNKWQFCNADTCNWFSCADCAAGSSCLNAC